MQRPPAVPAAQLTSIESFPAAPTPWPMQQHSQSLLDPAGPVGLVTSAAPADKRGICKDAGGSNEEHSTRTGNTVGTGLGCAARGSHRRGGRVLSSDGSLGSFMCAEATAAADAAAISRADIADAVRGSTGAQAPTAASAAGGTDRAPPSSCETPGLRHRSNATSEGGISVQRPAGSAVPSAGLEVSADGSSTTSSAEAVPQPRISMAATLAEEPLPSSSCRQERPPVDGDRSAQPATAEMTVSVSSRVLQAQTSLPLPPPQVTGHDADNAGRASEPAAASATAATRLEAKQMPSSGNGEPHVGHHAS